MVRPRIKLPARREGGAFAAIVSAAAVGAAGALVLLSHQLGQRSAHMAIHIASMNVLAPIVAASCASMLPRWSGRAGALWLTAAAQILLLWTWHVPAIERLASGSHAIHAAAHLTLFLSSFMFWSAVVRASDRSLWHAVAALLVSGKLICLLSALLVFSPRTLYGAAAAQLEDQQLAGLLMITACPLSYLIAAVVIVARLLTGIVDVRASGPSGAG
jgi:putative membrane protein